MIIHPSSSNPELFQHLRHLYISGMANASSIHWAGQISKKLLAHARKQIAEFFHVNANMVFFTSSWHEYFRIIILGRADLVREKDNFLSQMNIITFNTLPAKVIDIFQSRNFFRNVQFVSYQFDQTQQMSFSSFSSFVKSYQPKKSIVLFSLSDIMEYANDNKEFENLIDICHQNEFLLWVDVTDNIELISTNITTLQHFDCITLNHTAVSLPLATGVIIKKPTLSLAVQTFGGSQERGIRTGTENLLGSLFLGQAISQLQKYL